MVIFQTTAKFLAVLSAGAKSNFLTYLLFVILQSLILMGRERERERERESGGERAGCFTLIVFLMSCDLLCSADLPHGTMGWSAVCDCDIS